MKLISIFVLFFTSFSSCKNTVIKEKKTVNVALAGNAFLSKKAMNGTEEITANGLINWTNKDAVVSCFFKVSNTGLLSVALKASKSSVASIKVTVNEKPFTLQLKQANEQVLNVGDVLIDKPGYVKIDLQGISKTGDFFAEISEVVLSSSEPVIENLVYANDAENYYWSRRGPSCHLNYSTPNADKEFFYSELLVPAGEDKIGSYFMANGFGEGYFGIQVNSETERRVLFSVWEPEVGEKTVLVRKGNNVYAGRFDGEGTGGQSYLKYNWKVGNTYKFLTQGKPDNDGTVYSAWFYAPEDNKWQFIATWKRPKLKTYLTNFHGFLENFLEDNGHLARKAIWSNQWVKLANGTWSEVDTFKFTVDATGKNKQRMDFSGGLENNQFYLKNGGFFDNEVLPNTNFTKPKTAKIPEIDFNKLPLN